MGNAKRLERLRKRMGEEELDAFLVTSPENRRYLSGFTGSAGYLFITGTAAVLATDFRYTEQAGIQSPDYEVVRVAGAMDWFKSVAEGAAVKRIGFEANHVTVGLYQMLTESIKELGSPPGLAPTSFLVDQVRAVKEPEELVLLERAVYLADTAMDRVSERITPGMTERDVAWQMELTMRELGAEAISFDTIVAAGPNGARPHHRASDYAIQKGDVIVIDMGAKYEGYCSDITRTYVLGEPNEPFRKVYGIVLDAQETAEAAVQAGMTGGDTDGLARKVIAGAGYGETFGHSLGHGIGLAVHEFPRVGPSSPGVIEDGMVFSVEPGIYITGWGGVRIEDLVVMENGRARVLSKAHKQSLIRL